jgi:hypothetical protein
MAQLSSDRRRIDGSYSEAWEKSRLVGTFKAEKVIVEKP